MFTLPFALLVVVAASGAMASEWGPWATPKDSTLVAAGYKHDDGGSLIVTCDTKARLIANLIEEPRARWQPGSTMSVTTRADDGTESKSTGIIIGATRLIIKDESTFDLWTMGKAKGFFATGVGGYARIWPSANFRKAMEPVLHACGDHW